MWQGVFRSASEFKVRNLIYLTGLCAIYVRWLLGWRYISSLHSADEAQEGRTDETAVPCCDLDLSVLVMLVSRNVFHVVSALQSIPFIHMLFWLIRSLVDPTLAVCVLIVMGSLAVSYSFK